MTGQIESKICEILTQYPVKRAALFGSAARGETTERSDIDLLIEFLPDTRGLEFFGLRVDLEEALGCSVDLLTWKSLSKSKPAFKLNVESEAKLIYEH
jgi:predicted nucleotidyltransferase